MKAFNTLRDRLLLQLLSQPTQSALERVVFYNLEEDIKHFKEGWNPDHGEHVAPAAAHLADLMDGGEEWTAQLVESVA